MTERENALRRRLLVTFKAEAAEHVAALSRDLLDLERTPDGAHARQLIEAIFRGAHSLKGAARAVNLPDIESLCQALETVLAALKHAELQVSAPLLDVLLEAVAVLDQCQRAVESDRARPPVGPTLAALALARAGALPPRPSREAAPLEVASPPPPAAEQRAEDTVRVSAAALATVCVQAEELLPEKLAAMQQAAELHRLHDTFVDWRRRWARVRGELPGLTTATAADAGRAAETAHGAAGLHGFLEWNALFVDDLRQRLLRLAQTARQQERALTAKTETLFEDTRRLLMLPADWLVESLRRVVRDLARDQGKEAVLTIEGGAIEIDRRTLTELKDPFIHLLRNCLDHGIEFPEERERAGKPRAGAITIAISRLPGDRVELRVSDDGRGIDPERVKAAAVKAGRLEAAESTRMPDEQALDLVFQSDVTTNPMVTELSGRGLGLAIVREKAGKLGGSVAVESHVGRGTTMRLTVPWGRAVFRGVIVRAGERYLVVPTMHVDRVLRVEAKAIRTVENREAISCGERMLSLVRLSEVLGLPRAAAGASPAQRQPALVLSAGALQLACLVDEICAEQEVLVKSLGPQLQRLPHVTGATVLGPGRIAPILDTPELLRAAVRWSESRGTSGAAADPAVAAGPRRILVAEDSITSRMLIKTILESAGYSVATAVDGIDALTQLRSGDFDLVVSDVDMPRLDGLGLTARIRSDRSLAELPVVLVTSLDSRADRERGIEVGANAYLVKRSFEQSNLLEVVRRLLGTTLHRQSR